jgi:hypothetical protein
MSENIKYIVNDSRVVSETIEGETILINLETGTYYSLNTTATLIWQCIKQGFNFSLMIIFLSDRYDGNNPDIKKGVSHLLDLLTKDGLIIQKEDHSESKLDSFSGPKEQFQVPVIESYVDMQEMLLADPVHDVDPSGWPKLKNNS